MKSSFQQLVEVNVGINENLKKQTELLEKIHESNIQDHIEIKSEMKGFNTKWFRVTLLLLAALIIVVGAKEAISFFG